MVFTLRPSCSESRDDGSGFKGWSGEGREGRVPGVGWDLGRQKGLDEYMDEYYLCRQFLVAFMTHLRKIKKINIALIKGINSYFLDTRFHRAFALDFHISEILIVLIW